MSLDVLLLTAALVVAEPGSEPRRAKSVGSDWAQAGAPGGPGLALRAAKLLTLADNRPVIDHGVLLVRNGLIDAVGAAADVTIPAEYVVRDVGQRWLMPGLIELHNHIGTPTAFFPNDINDVVYLTNPGLRASASVVPNNALLRTGVAGGVTAALFIPGSGSNMGGQGVLFKLAPATYEEMEIRNPGSLKLAQSGNPESWTVGVGRSFMNWNTRNTFRRGAAYARHWREYEAGSGPRPEKDIQFEIFRALDNGSAQVSTHTQFYQVVLMTVTMAKELGFKFFIDHGSFGGYHAAAYAQAAGVDAILGPRMIATTRVNWQWDDNDTDGKVLGMAAEYQRRGHTAIGFNTDCVDNGAFNITPPQEELSLQAGMALRYGFDNPNLENLRALTIVPARTVGLGDRLGTLEVGKDADVLVLTGDVGDPRTSIEFVFTNGELVYDTERGDRRW